MKTSEKFFLFIFIFFFFMGGLFWWQKKLEEFIFDFIYEPLKTAPIIEIKERTKPEIRADAVFSFVILNSGKEKILFKKNENEILPIASLSKLMTALVVFENKENFDLSEKIVFDREVKTIKEVLEKMLYFSDNEAAETLAEKFGRENFIEMMNKKAVELSLSNTHFSNPTGLDPEELTFSNLTKDFFNHSTAQEMALLAKYILKERPEIFELTNKDIQFEFLEGQKIVGTKTGYTKEAGGCLLVVFADKNGNYFINVILGARDKDKRFAEMQKLINWINNKT
jgi:D-alanyl-D-alanine carboxypeptidase